MIEAQTLLRLPMPMGGCAPPVPCDTYRKFGKFGTDVETTRSSGVDAKKWELFSDFAGKIVQFFGLVSSFK